MKLFLQWANNEEMKKKFKYPTQFCFGGFINQIGSPHYIERYLLDGDVIDVLGLLFGIDVSLTDLMEDGGIVTAVFGPEITNEEIQNRILITQSHASLT